MIATVLYSRLLSHETLCIYQIEVLVTPLPDTQGIQIYKQNYLIHLKPLTIVYITFEQYKTHCVALVLCLNVGVDPPDVVKTQPCARLECWIGMYYMRIFILPDSYLIGLVFDSKQG